MKTEGSRITLERGDLIPLNYEVMRLVEDGETVDGPDGSPVSIKNRRLNKWWIRPHKPWGSEKIQSDERDKDWVLICYEPTQTQIASFVLIGKLLDSLNAKEIT